MFLGSVERLGALGYFMLNLVTVFEKLHSMSRYLHVWCTV